MGCTTTRATSPRLAPRSNSSQFLQDPSFSAGPNGTAWQKSSNGGRTLIDGNHPRTAPYSADLCQNAANCADGVAQLITRPGFIISATLTYWFTLRSPGDPTACNDLLQIGMQQPSAGPSYGVTYCPDWNGAPYVQDSIDETLFLRNMQSQTGEVYVVVQAFSDSGGASRFWVDDITLEIVWGTPPSEPTGLLAEPHNGSVTLHWQAPASGSEPITSNEIQVFAGDGSYWRYTIDTGTTTAVVVQLVDGLAYSFKVAAISAAGEGPFSAVSNTVTPAVTLSYERVSTQQFGLSNSDGITWQPLGQGLYNEGLGLTVTTPGDAMALVTANADLWTSGPGVNQDLGIYVKGLTPGPIYPTVPGQPETWKESGGYNGTFSPNAAAIHAGLFLSAGSYEFTLVWKANKPSPGATIYAGAGPIGSDFSPTRLTVQVFPMAANRVVDSASTSQFHPTTPSDGATFTDLGPGSPAIHYLASGNGVAMLVGNADLWTTTAGFNQDLAITVNGSVTAWKESGSYGGTYSPNAALVETVMPVASSMTYDVKLQLKPNRASYYPPIYAGDLGIAVSSSLGTYNADRVGWKESGAVIGTYSPNAAYVQAAFPMVGGTAYTIKLQWKSNRAQSSPTIYAGAGPGAPYSRTRLTAELLCPPVPVLTSLSPSSGPSSGGTTVTINGSNLDQGTVFFGATQAPVTSWAAAQIVVTSPTHPVGTFDVTVRTGNGTTATSAADRFSYAYPPAILADSPSFYYRFGEKSGTVAADSSGNSRDATYSASGVTLGAAGAIAGDADTAITFDATNGIVQQKPGTGLPLGNSSRSVECWFNTTYSGNMTIAAWGTRTAGANQFFGVRIAAGTQSGVVVDFGNGNWGLPTTPSSTNLADGKWHHLVVTYDGSSGGMIAADIDGQLFGSRTISSSLSTTLSVQGLMMGSDPTDPNMTGDLFKGSMDELAIGFTSGLWQDPSVQWLVGRNASVFGFYLGRRLGHLGDDPDHDHADAHR